MESINQASYNEDAQWAHNTNFTATRHNSVQRRTCLQLLQRFVINENTYHIKT